MPRTTRSATERITSVLKRGPRKGLTAEIVAARAEANLNTTRTILWSLTTSGTATVVGTESREFGRPANLYALAA